VIPQQHQQQQQQLQQQSQQRHSSVFNNQFAHHPNIHYSAPAQMQTNANNNTLLNSNNSIYISKEMKQNYETTNSTLFSLPTQQDLEFKQQKHTERQTQSPENEQQQQQIQQQENEQQQNAEHDTLRNKLRASQELSSRMMNDGGTNNKLNQ
jgi:hypothetical protein